MPTKKIADLPYSKPCRNSEHNPPSMRVFEPGAYEHTCPSCGHKTTFTVPERTRLSAFGRYSPPHFKSRLY